MSDLGGFDAIKGAADRPNEWYIHCPFCGDKRHKCGINTQKGVYHCYVCEAKGKFADTKELAILADYRETSTMADIRKRLDKTGKTQEPKTFDLDAISWPISRQETPLAYRYMRERRYVDNELVRYSVRVGKPYWDESLGYEVKKWSGRIIFPFFYEGRCTYLVGRTYNDGDPKYVNCSATKGLVVYGIDQIVGDKVILCEGIISAHAAERSTGISAVALLGKDPLFTQVSRLRSQCSKIYKSLDGDVDERKNKKVDKTLVKAGFQVWEVSLPVDQDPDSLQDKYLEYFNAAKQITLF